LDVNGKIVGIGQENYDVQTPSIGYAEQDIELLWEATARTIRQAITNGNINSSKYLYLQD
jgi:xylulokinase